jgi:ribosomal-protein-alanine N-acetyltransferase
MIKIIQSEDANMLASYYSKNIDHFREWEPVRSESFYTIDECLNRIEKWETSDNTTSVFFVYIQNGEIIGHCELSQIVHGSFKACYMGYGISKEYVGKSKAYELCKYVVNYAFEELELNRVMANYIQRNERSGRLLERLGFQKEGLAKRYLKIAGKWQDHVLTSLLNPVSA